jgi:hypothetical protein
MTKSLPFVASGPSRAAVLSGVNVLVKAASGPNKHLVKLIGLLLAGQTHTPSGVKDFLSLADEELMSRPEGPTAAQLHHAHATFQLIDRATRCGFDKAVARCWGMYRREAYAALRARTPSTLLFITDKRCLEHGIQKHVEKPARLREAFLASKVLSNSPKIIFRSHVSEDAYYPVRRPDGTYLEEVRAGANQCVLHHPRVPWPGRLSRFLPVCRCSACTRWSTSTGSAGGSTWRWRTCGR